MIFAKHSVERQGREIGIGDSVKRKLDEIYSQQPYAQVICVVPKLLGYFGSNPERFEVVEADIIVRY